MLDEIVRAGTRQRQDHLRKDYKENPEKALITDRARTKGGVYTDPFHGNVAIGKNEFGVVLPFGIHKAVGGYSDAPNPGDLLCAAIAACIDSTIRIISDRFNVKLMHLEVEVKGEVDVRGTLLVDRNVPVGFQSIKSQINIRAEEGTAEKVLQKILAAAEHSCVNLQTLISDVSIQTNVN